MTQEFLRYFVFFFKCFFFSSLSFSFNLSYFKDEKIGRDSNAKSYLLVDFCKRKFSARKKINIIENLTI